MDCTQCGERPAYKHGSSYCNRCRYARQRLYDVCSKCGDCMPSTKANACESCQYKSKLARAIPGRLCRCGQKVADLSSTQCRICKAGGRDRYLAQKREERERRAIRDGHVLPAVRGNRADEGARKAVREASYRERVALTAPLRELLRGITRLMREKEAEPSSVSYTKRYRSNPMFRESERLRTRDMKLRRSVGIEAVSDGSLTPKALCSLFAAARVCPYCAKRMKSEHKSLDHVVPLSKGGAHSILNAVVCCKRCNSRKGVKDVRDFLPVGVTLPLIVA